METDSCKDYLRGQILAAFKSAFSNMSQKSAILITDDKTTKILDSCLKVHTLNDLGIGALVNVKFKRERVRVPPIYFLTSSLPSIKGVIKDYEDSRKPQYAGNAHLLICSSMTKDCLDLLKTSNLRRHLKTFQEVYCDYHAFESRVFHFNRPESFRNLYISASLQNEFAVNSEKLFNFCVSIEEDPYIRCCKDSQLARKFAQTFESFFSMKKNEMKLFKPQTKRATLIILDRSQDTVTPLMHEITYQAMIKDLLPGGDWKYLPLKSSDDSSEDSAAARFYYEDDPLWADFRHENLPHVLKNLQTKLTEFKKTNRIAKQQVNEEEKDNLLKSVRDLPKYKRMTKSFNTHFEIKDKLVDLYKSLKLNMVADIEQSLVTGIDDGGKSVRLNDVQKELTTLLRDVTVLKDIKIRLLLLYIISQGGINEKQHLLLFDAAGLSQKEREVIYNSAALGVTIKSEKKSSYKPLFFKERQASAKQLSKSTVTQSRYEPLISTVLKKFDKGGLSEADCPVFGKGEHGTNITGTFGGRSLRTRTKSAHKKSKIIIFVLGGVCYSEIRECYLLAEKLRREIYIGSSHVISPKDFLSLLGGQEDEAVIDVKEDEKIEIDNV